MMSSDAKGNAEDLVDALKSELDVAIEGWEKSIAQEDWGEAKKMLHREKVLLETLGINEYDHLIDFFLYEQKIFESHKMKLLYSSILNAFKAIKRGLK